METRKLVFAGGAMSVLVASLGCVVLSIPADFTLDSLRPDGLAASALREMGPAGELLRRWGYGCLGVLLAALAFEGYLDWRRKSGEPALKASDGDIAQIYAGASALMVGGSVILAALSLQQVVLANLRTEDALLSVVLRARRDPAALQQGQAKKSAETRR